MTGPTEPTGVSATSIRYSASCATVNTADPARFIPGEVLALEDVTIKAADSRILDGRFRVDAGTRITVTGRLAEGVVLLLRVGERGA